MLELLGRDVAAKHVEAERLCYSRDKQHIKSKEQAHAAQVGN